MVKEEIEYGVIYKDKTEKEMTGFDKDLTDRYLWFQITMRKTMLVHNIETL